MSVFARPLIPAAAGPFQAAPLLPEAAAALAEAAPYLLMAAAGLFPEMPCEPLTPFPEINV